MSEKKMFDGLEFQKVEIKFVWARKEGRRIQMVGENGKKGFWTQVEEFKTWEGKGKEDDFKL